MKLFDDILMTIDPEKGGEPKVSQSRLYLFITFITMIGVLIGSLWIDNAQVEIIQNTTTTLLYMIVIFGGYSLTGKGFKTIEKIKNGIKKDE